MSLATARAERVAHLFEGVGEPLPPAEARRRAAAFRRAYLAGRRPVVGATAFLRYAHRRARVIVVTNNLEAEQQAKLRHLRLARYVDGLVTSEREGAAKPDARLFLAGLRKAGVGPEEAVVLGDSYRSDVVGARAADLAVVWFNRFGARPPSPLLPVPEIARLHPPRNAWAAIERAHERPRRPRGRGD